LVEARSVPGFSGSPVFVFDQKPDGGVIGPGFWSPNKEQRELPHGAQIRKPLRRPKLLGVDWGHINDYLEVYDDNRRLLPFKIKSNSGLMTVVPVKFLEMMLNHPDVKRMNARRTRRQDYSRARNI
jgi:hypothetical protein